MEVSDVVVANTARSIVALARRPRATGPDAALGREVRVRTVRIGPSGDNLESIRVDELDARRIQLGKRLSGRKRRRVEDRGRVAPVVIAVDRSQENVRLVPRVHEYGILADGLAGDARRRMPGALIGASRFE